MFQIYRSSCFRVCGSECFRVCQSPCFRVCQSPCFRVCWSPCFRLCRHVSDISVAMFQIYRPPCFRYIGRHVSDLSVIMFQGMSVAMFQGVLVPMFQALSPCFRSVGRHVSDISVAMFQIYRSPCFRSVGHDVSGSVDRQVSCSVGRRSFSWSTRKTITELVICGKWSGVVWFKQKCIRDKIKIQRIIMCSSTSYSL